MAIPAAMSPVGSANPASTGASNPPSPTPGAADFRELIGMDWQLEAGTERYFCVRKQLDQTKFVAGWRSESPPGTHHVFLTQSPEPDGFPDGASECDVATLGTENLFGAGIGGMPRQLPEGFAMKLQAGSQLLLNLHLFNVTDRPLSGHSSSWISAIDEKDVKTLADGVVAGPVKLNVPPGRSTSIGTCTFDRAGTLFGIMPHMHQLGVAMRVVAHSPARADVVLFDGPYNFDNQLTYPIDMLPFQAGDTVQITCSYENPTDQTRHWGESSNDEMCIAGLARFPAGGKSVCTK